MSGTLRDVLVSAEMAIDAKADPTISLEALDGAATLDRVELDVLAPQPPLIVEGRARLDLEGLSATVDRAVLRDLELGPGTVRLSGWRGGGLALNVETRWRGPLQSVLSTITGEPWPLIKRAQNFADATASTAGDLLVDARLGESAKSQPPQLRVRARIEGLEWQSGLLDLPISRGNLDFTFGDGEIGVDGDVVLGSSPVHVTLRHRVDDAEPRDSVRVEGRLDPATARSLGLPERRFLDGSVGVIASYTRNHDGAGEVQAQLDLTAAALELAEAGIEKQVGEKASAQLEARVDPAGTLDVRSLVVDAPELQGSARASATTEPFRLESATVERLRIGESELTGAVRRRADGGFSVTVDAKRLDLRSLLADEDGDDASGRGRRRENHRRVWGAEHCSSTSKAAPARSFSYMTSKPSGSLPKDRGTANAGTGCRFMAPSTTPLRSPSTSTAAMPPAASASWRTTSGGSGERSPRSRRSRAARCD